MTNHIDEGKGLYHKFDVHKLYDWDHKHTGCRYFVLDPFHDEHARGALLEYADRAQHDHPALAADLRAWVERLDGEDKDSDDHNE